jgi:hypothetical protein
VSISRHLRPPHSRPIPRRLRTRVAATGGTTLDDVIRSEVVVEDPALRKLLVKIYDARLANRDPVDGRNGTPGWVSPAPSEGDPR